MKNKNKYIFEKEGIWIFLMVACALLFLIVGLSIRVPIKNIGYIACYNMYGEGPMGGFAHECGDMYIKCYTERGGERLLCPLFGNKY